MTASSQHFRYPRRRLIRAILHYLAPPAFATLTRLEIHGKENLPKTGPCLVVANHFSFADPAVIVRLARWPMEFLGGADPPNAPIWSRLLPWLWGIYKLYRGTGSRDALKAAEAVMQQNGILGIFPEGGSWASVLRPPRPGTAFIATRANAPLVPIGLSGVTEIFPAIKKGQRAKVIVKIGKPFGPFKVTGRGRARRDELDEIGHEIMRQIAQLLPEEERGFYSTDLAIRAAAKGTEIYPWADRIEGEVEGEIR
jgi:1-acyl-sn-glycerol-3-phosphate acyltransferase